MQDLTEHLVSRGSLLLNAVCHQLGLKNVKRCDDETSKGTSHTTVQGIRYCRKLNGAFAFLSAVGNQLDLAHFEDFIEGKLYGAEWYLSQDQWKIALVETPDALMLYYICSTLYHATVVSKLEILFHDLKGISHKGLSYLGESSGDNMLDWYVNSITHYRK